MLNTLTKIVDTTAFPYTYNCFYIYLWLQRKLSCFLRKQRMCKIPWCPYWFKVILDASYHIYFYQIYLIMHDVSNNVTPPNASKFFTYSSKVRHHNTRFSAAGNFYIEHSRTDHYEELLFKNWCKNMELYSRSTVIVLYLNINSRIPYRVGCWIFCYWKILMLACVL